MPPFLFLQALVLLWKADIFIVIAAATQLGALMTGCRATPEGDNELNELTDLPAAISQIPVRVSYYAADLFYGSDMGIFCVVEDILYFKGIKSDFTLHYRDLQVTPSNQSDPQDRYSVPSKYEVVYGGPALQGKVKIEIWVPNNLSTVDYKKAFWREIRSLSLPSPDQPISNLYPPCVPDVDYLRRRSLEGRWTRCFAWLTFLVAFLPIGTPFGATAFWFYHGAVVVVASVLWYVSRSAMNDVSRLQSLAHDSRLEATTVSQSALPMESESSAEEGFRVSP